jgi:hypothetical protein
MSASQPTATRRHFCVSGSKLSRNGSHAEEDMPTIEEVFRLSLDAARARREREHRIRRRMRRLKVAAFLLFLIATYFILVTYG